MLKESMNCPSRLFGWAAAGNPPLLGGRFRRQGGAETDQVPVWVGVGALAEPVGGGADRAGMAADARPAPLLVEGIGITHIQIRRGGVVRRIVAGGGREMQPGAFAVGEAGLAPGT